MWILVALAIGALVGYLASRFWGSSETRKFDHMLVGMIGGFIGNRMFESIGGKMGEEVTQDMNLQLLTATVGAIAVVLFIRTVRAGRGNDKN